MPLHFLHLLHRAFATTLEEGKETTVNEQQLLGSVDESDCHGACVDNVPENDEDMQTEQDVESIVETNSDGGSADDHDNDEDACKDVPVDSKDARNEETLSAGNILLHVIIPGRRTRHVLKPTCM